MDGVRLRHMVREEPERKLYEKEEPE